MNRESSRLLIYLPGVYIAFAQHLFIIFSAFSQHFLSICSAFAQNLLSICSVFAQHLLSLCSAFAQYLLSICFANITLGRHLSTEQTIKSYLNTEEQIEQIILEILCCASKLFSVIARVGALLQMCANDKTQSDGHYFLHCTLTTVWFFSHR